MHDPFEHIMPITPRPAAIMVRGEGDYLWDADGRRYLDMVQGWAVNALGHCPPRLTRAISSQAGTLMHAGAAFHNGPQLSLASQLCEASGLDEVFFCNSGAEANEGAIKLARKWGQLHRAGAATVVTTRNSFHGRTLATMAASGKPGFSERYPPGIGGFSHVAFGDLAAMAAAIGRDTAAVMVEPIQGEAGVVVPPPDYLAGLRALTRERGVLLILDEVQTGIGRTGTLFAHEQADITPDIMTLGKGLGGGFPVAGLMCSHAVSCFEPGDQGGTFNGNPLAMAAGLAVIEAVTAPGFLDGVMGRGQRLAEGLSQLPGVERVRGRGLLLAAVLTEPRAAAVQQRCMASGLLINAPQPNTLRLMPALNVSDRALSDCLETLRRALAAKCDS